MGYWTPTKDLELMVNIFKVGIRNIHKETDKIFINKFLLGGVAQMTYAKFLSQMYFVYQAMEEEIKYNRNNFCVGPIYFPEELNRVPALEEDLEYFYGPQWHSQISMLPETVDYVARLRHIGKLQPELLMAQAFSRYMGDLFGGQILKRKWKRVFKFPDDHGTRFYQFDKIDVKKFRDHFEAQVNGIELKINEKHDQLEEMKLAFKFNTQLVLEVLEWARQTPGGFLQENPSAGKSWEQEMEELGAAEVGTCVFAPKDAPTAAQCPFHKTSSPATTYTTYGLIMCATLVIAYPLVRRIINGPTG